MIRKCPDCGRSLNFAQNRDDHYTYLICPNCRVATKDGKYVTVEERISQGYSRYTTREENLADYLRGLLDKDDI